ncbi:hypothetical protein HPE56_09140 [Maribacter sp. ANRC-HE7]|uniref:RNA polymerase sigma factor, sigma-70 family n=1 Tax=Maribacter aquimaris TaxID=2737171 RepID=A0ABR7UZD6_9FLAO|nr:hypothetical protein [Maribacter aquimaris]MBD0777959.1 hypothetical protein [Maribacter aquimaris]
MVVKQLARHKEENDFEQFYSKIATLEPDLKRFMARSLKVAENQGVIDRGYYSADELLDEIYIEVFKEFLDYIDVDKLKTILFSKAVQKIEEKKVIEQETPEYVSTEEMLKNEMNALDEAFTTQADGDLILNTELDDISYKQATKRPNEVLLDSTIEQQLIKKMEMNDSLLPSLERRTTFGALYNNIPPRSKWVLDLYAFGNRNEVEISRILEVPESIIVGILEKLKARFSLLE